MAWYNPLDWPSAITGGAYTVASYVAYPVSKDYSEFLASAGDPKYIPKALRGAAASTVEERAAQSAEGNRYTNRAVKEMAPAVETTVVTAAQVASHFTPAGIGGGVAAEMITDALLEARGEAPTRSLIKLNSPISQDADLGMVGNFLAAGFRGDKHYQSGLLPDQHPQRLHAQANQQSQNMPNNTSNGGQGQAPSGGFMAGIQKGMRSLSEGSGGFLGIASIIGLIVGIVLLPIAWPIAIGAAALGFLGQKVWSDSSKQPNTPAPTAYTPPVSNHPRSEAGTVPEQYRPQQDLPTAKPENVKER